MLSEVALSFPQVSAQPQTSAPKPQKTLPAISAETKGNGNFASYLGFQHRGVEGYSGQINPSKCLEQGFMPRRRHSGLRNNVESLEETGPWEHGEDTLIYGM